MNHYVGFELYESEAIQNTKNSVVKYTLDNELLTRVHINSNLKQIVIPQNLVDTILKVAHSHPMSGHLNCHKMINLITKKYWWPDLDNSVRNYVQKCLECQKPVNNRHHKILPIRQPVISKVPFSEIAIDFIGPLEICSNGDRFIISVIDMSTRYACAYSLPNQTAECALNILLKRIFCTYGLPKIMISDCGKQFKSKLFEDFCNKHNIVQRFTSPWHPQSNGVCERFHGTLFSKIRKLFLEHNTMWNENIEFALCSYNSAIQDSTKFSSNEIVFVHDLNLPIHVITPDFDNNDYQVPTESYVKNAKELINEKLAIASENINKSQIRNINYVIPKLKHRQFKVNDLVLLKHLIGNARKLSLIGKVPIK